jgi:transposase
MRGQEQFQEEMFSYGSLSQRVPMDHPLRRVRVLADEAMASLEGRFSEVYSRMGRPSVPPEQMLRALLLQMLYSVRSERMLIEQMEYNLLFRWFVGLGMNEPVWDATSFSKNRERLLSGDVAQAMPPALPARSRCLRPARVRRQPEETQMGRALLRMAEDDGQPGQDPPPRTPQAGLELHPRRRSLQPRPNPFSQPGNLVSHPHPANGNAQTSTPDPSNRPSVPLHPPPSRKNDHFFSSL